MQGRDLGGFPVQGQVLQAVDETVQLRVVMGVVGERVSEEGGRLFLAL